MFSKSKTTSLAVIGEAQQAKTKKKRRFWQTARRRTFWFLVLAFIAHSTLNVYASLQLNRELAAIRQSGAPLQFSEREPPAVPPTQNAAVIYKQATDALRFSTDEKVAMKTSRRSRTPQMEQLMKTALRKNEKALVLTHQAAAMPQCRFPLDWSSNPTQFKFPYYGDLRELARLLGEHARLEAQDGHRDAALQDVRAIFGISHHLSDEPYLIGFLVAQSIDAIGHRALAQVLERVPLSVAEAHALEASLPRDDWKRAFRQSLVGERMMGLYAFESLGKASSNQVTQEETRNNWTTTWFTYPLLWLWRPILKLDEVHSLRLWKQLIDSSASQQVPRPVGFNTVFEEAIQTTPRYAVLTRILFPVFTRSSDNRDFAEVRRRQREVALALASYHTSRGYYPDHLQEVTSLWGKPLPLDPYNQKLFGYRRLGQSFLLYSVGVNRLDDKGHGPYEVGKKANSTADDIAWLNESKEK